MERGSSQCCPFSEASLKPLPELTFPDCSLTLGNAVDNL